MPARLERNDVPVENFGLMFLSDMQLRLSYFSRNYNRCL